MRILRCGVCVAAAAWFGRRFFVAVRELAHLGEDPTPPDGDERVPPTRRPNQVGRLWSAGEASELPDLFAGRRG